MKFACEGSSAPHQTVRRGTALKNSAKAGRATLGLLVGVGGNWCGGVGAHTPNPRLQAIHVDVNDRRGEERKHLAENEAADDGGGKRGGQLGANSRAKRERHGREKGGHGGHQNRTETQQAGLVDRVDGRQSLFPFHLNRKINHENGVFLNDADQEDDADERDDVQIGLDELDREERADASGRNRGEDGDGMNEALVEDAENDVNGGESSKNQHRLMGERILKSLRGALKGGVNGIGHAEFAASLFDVLDRGTERSAGSKIE